LQLFLAVIFEGIIFGIYLSCFKFLGVMSAGSGLYKLLYFAAFMAVMYGWRAFMKLVGLTIDAGKRGSSSYYFQCEVVVMAFYFLFYRMLFASLESWLAFALLEGLHLLSEWFLYAIRATEWYFRTSSRIIARFDFLPEIVLRILGKSSLNSAQWAAFLCLDFGLRSSVMLALTISWAGNSAILRYSYNAPMYSGFSAIDTPQASFELNMIFLAVAIVLEFLNAAVMEFTVWRAKRLSLRYLVLRLLDNDKFVLYAASVLATIMCNAFSARIVLNFAVPYGVQPSGT
jgi:hypothetical protein